MSADIDLCFDCGCLLIRALIFRTTCNQGIATLFYCFVFVSVTNQTEFSIIVEAKTESRIHVFYGHKGDDFHLCTLRVRSIIWRKELIITIPEKNVEGEINEKAQFVIVSTSETYVLHDI